MRMFAYSGIVVWVLCGCAPSLDWRQVRPEGASIRAQFPCRPASHARTVQLVGRSLTMTMYACAAQGMTFGLAIVDVLDVRQVDAALGELATSAARNVGTSSSDGQPLQVRGMTPQPRARAYEHRGRLPDGKGIVEQVAVFAHGSQVFQATVLGSQLDPLAAETYFTGLQFVP